MSSSSERFNLDNKSAGQTERPSPVQVAFEQELSRFVKYITRKSELGAKWKKADDEAFARGSNTLFKLFNSYESRLQHSYFIQKMISTGNHLFAIKEYKIAMFQCYGRYLSSIRPPNTTLGSSTDSDIEGFKATYFPNGLADRYATITLQGLLGEAISSFHIHISEDLKLENPKTIAKSISVLKVLRLITQTALHKETFCWLVFNGTIHIYTICRHLMGLSFSKEVLEFLLWACMCMESSVPLMTVKYLFWRCTLYSAVCQCYYDLKAVTQAEAFAKRALKKVNELEDIERISTSETTLLSVGTFREAKAKMQIMVFKRVVFETRKRPKGLLRPKTKPNFKDSINQPWPRTPVERLLTDLLQANTSAQFLAILEALSDSSRRTLHCEPPPIDTEDSMTDVHGELFFAGMEIIAGGGGPKHQHAMKHDADIHPSFEQLGNRSLVELIRDGSRGVPLQSVVKFVKYAFSYEQWETFNCLVNQTLELLKNQENSACLLDIKTLELMLAIEPFYTNIKKPKKAVSHNAVDENTDQTAHGKSTSTIEDLMVLAETLHSCSVEPFKSVIGHMDRDMIIDAALFLWSKCKVQFHRVSSASMEGCKFVLNDKDASKWMYLITVVHTALSWSDACVFDPIIFSEVALKLSLVLECKSSQNEQHAKIESPGIQESPNPANQQERTSKTKRSNPDATDKQLERSQTRSSNLSNHSSVLGLSEEGYSHGVRGLLSKSRDVLYQAYTGVGRAWDSKMKATGKDIVDLTLIKDSQDKLMNDYEQEDIVQSIIKALHMELLFVHHRVTVKLMELGQDPELACSQKKTKSKQDATVAEHRDDNDLIVSCDKNPLSKALLLMHKASCAASLKGITGSEEQAQLMEECVELIQKAQHQDQKLFDYNKEPTTSTDTIPPPPILLYRSPSTMVFKPAPFEPRYEKVAWYSLFARSASGNNIKVRLNDYQLPGTGEESPATNDCLFIVKGLKPNLRYVFAVAAYNSKGQLIGKTIGSTSRPILATYSLPILMAWGYLAQISYSAGVPSIAQQACAVLWDHFVIEPQPTEEEMKIQSADNDFRIKMKVLDQEKIHGSSPVLVRQFLQSILIVVDLNVRENFLFCNSLCDNGPLYNSQIKRLEECERLLLAIQVAGWLNDAPLCLQSIVQVYGLLAPIIQQKIPAKPVIQVLLRCHSVLQEVPSLTRHRRQSSVSDSLSHMIAAMTYFVAKILQIWEEKGLCGAIVELGKKMLNLETAPDSAGTMTSMQQAAAIATANMVGQPPPKTKKRPKPKHKGAKGKGLDKDLNNLHDGYGEELKTLETFMLKLSQKALQNREDDELTGSEDPMILNCYVSSLPATEAYKEVLKFKRRTRFLEFFVKVLGKAIDEGLIETCLNWTNDTMTWIIRRNEMLLANKPTIVRMGTTGVGQEEEKIKRFATAIVEFGKTTAKQQTAHQNEVKDVEPDEVRVRAKQETSKPPMSKNVKSSIMSRKTGKTEGKTEDEINFNLAVEKLQTVLPEYWRSYNRRKKLRSVNKEELPWKVQLNVLTAGCNLELFLEGVGSLQRFTDDGGIAMFGPSFMDPDWFSFSTSGTLIVSWMGTCSRDSANQPTGFSGSVMESPPYASPAVTTAHTMHIQKRVSQPVNETIRAGSRVTASDRESTAVPKSPLIYLGNVFSNLTRAIVLAHRGKYWTMMQNACRCLWNATNTIMMQVMSGGLRLTDDPMGETKSDIDILRQALWKPFYTAADCLMDMMVHLQDNVKLDGQLDKKHNKVKKGDHEISEISGLMGGVVDQKGGSSLRFEIPLDNTNILDTRWVKQLILYAAEMMFFETKWERVVDVILRFNALSRSRYAESVLPMLIVAQKKLSQRIEESGGLSKSQPVITISKETGVAEEFVITPAEYEKIEPAVHLDPVGHNVYSFSTDALRLVSVPLDINESLNAFRQALDIKHHTARALEHSRQLLLCYLAGQQKGGSSRKIVRRGSSRVGFMPSQVKPPSDVPADLSTELFENVEDIKVYTLHPSQLAIVISSYDKTIEMLQFKHQHGLAAQAMHELGNIMFHTGNIRMAYRWWAEALDTILNITDSMKHWRDINSDQDTSLTNVLLKRCGLWGCLLAAILASKIARYVHTSNIGLRLECCHLSSILFKTLLCSTLPHPTADKDYALYEIGYGCEVKDLIPGVDLLSDMFRGDGRSVVAALRWVTEELSRARYLITVLPLISLCLYFTKHVCRDVKRTVDVQILRVRVLTDLGLFSQSISVLNELLNGTNLPRASRDRDVADAKKTQPADFSNSKGFVDSVNVDVINQLIEQSLPDSFASLYGDYLSTQVNIAHAHLLIAMATKIYAIPANMTEQLKNFFLEKAEAEAAEEAENDPEPSITSTVLALGKKLGKAKKSDETLSEKSFTMVSQRKLVTTETSTKTLKGLLLCQAENILKGVLDSIQRGDDEDLQMEAEISSSLSPCDLESLVFAKLELGMISLERHHAVTSGKVIYSAMRAIEDAAVLTDLDTETRSPSMLNTRSLQSTPPDLFSDHYLASQSRQRLDARLWLTCRLALAKSLSEEDSGMGKLGGLARSITAKIGSCEHHCRQGVDEADAFGDIEIAAEFAMLDFVYSLQHGKISDELIGKLEDIIIRLERCHKLSYQGQYLLATAVIQYADINKQGSRSQELKHIGDPMKAYEQATSVILKQMINLGECIDITSKSPVLPLKNIYLQQISLLVQLKLRFGRASGYNTMDKNEDIIQSLTSALKALELGISLLRDASYQEQPTKAKLLCSLGQVQRQMFNKGLLPARTAVNTLIDAIKQTYSSDHDLGMMKQAYMEIAITYLTNIKNAREADEQLIAAEALAADQQKPLKADKKETKQKIKKSKESNERQKEIEKEKRAAWAAVRAASLVSMAQHQLGLMTGDPEISSLKISERSGQLVPDFAIIDLLGTDDILPGKGNSFVGINGDVTMGSTVNNSNTVRITWIHLLGYLSLLRRQCSYKALGVNSSMGNGTYSLASSPLFCGRKTQKLAHIHDFLMKELDPYTSDCCGIFPVAGLSLLPSPRVADTDTKAAQDRDSDKTKTFVNGFSTSSAKEFELSVYWGRLEMDTSFLDKDGGVSVFVYGLNSKAFIMSSTTGTNALKTGLCYIPSPLAQTLHEELMNTLELADNDLQVAPTQANPPTAKTSKSDLSIPGVQDNKSVQSSSTGRKKRSMGIRALSARQRRDDTIRAKLKEHIQKISSMLNLSQENTSQDVPFEVSLKNVSVLEALFDPGRGLTSKVTEAFFNWFSSIVQEC